MSRAGPFPRLVYDPVRRSLYVYFRDRRPEDVTRSEHAGLQLGFAEDRRLVALTLEETRTTHLGPLTSASRVTGVLIGEHRQFVDLPLGDGAAETNRAPWDAICDFDPCGDLLGFQVFFGPKFGDPRFFLKGLEVETVTFV